MNKIDKINVVKSSGTEVPEVYTETSKRGSRIIAPIVISEENGVYTWLTLRLRKDEYNYENVVSTIIGLKYDNSDMMAIINNYIFDKKVAKYKKEFDEMQEWRSLAKKCSKQHFGITE